MREPHMKIRIFLMAVFLMAALPLAGCKKPEKPAGGPPPNAPREVSFVVVAPERVALTTELPGRTAPNLIAEIRPQVGGIIKKRAFTEGADVKAGQVLYEIDPAPSEAVLENAMANREAMLKSVERARAALSASVADLAKLQAAVDLTQANKKRYEESFKDKSVSAIQRDQAVTEAKSAEAALQAAKALVESNRDAVAMASANVQQAEAAIKTARINHGYTKVTAPIAGRIGKSSVTEGAIVTAYQPMALATIQQLDPIYVDVPQATTDLLRLKSRMKKGLLSQDEKEQSKVELILEDGTRYPQQGTLQFSDVTVDSSTGSVNLRAVFPNPDGILLPGMFVRALIQEGVNEQAILIPQQGVSRDPKGNAMALIVDNEDKAGLRPLTIDRAIGSKWLVASGLAPGDRLIVEGLQMLRPGAPVKATPFKEGESRPANAPQPAASK